MLAQLTLEKKRDGYIASFDGKTLSVFDPDNDIMFSIDRDAQTGFETVLRLCDEVVSEYDALAEYQKETAELNHLSEMGVEGV